MHTSFNVGFNSSHKIMQALATPSDVVGGGYKYQFVSTPADWLICNICQCPSREPYLSGCCGHTFCKSCLGQATNACPICHSTEFASVPNKQVERAIGNLLVFCNNKEEGCEWQGEVNDISNHLEHSNGCQFQEVMCSNDCGKCLQRQYLTSHAEDECVRRKVDCQYCHITGEHQFIEGEHKGQCHKFPTACPNNCEVDNLLRENIGEHLKICPLELIECEYCIVGCEVKMVRKDQKKHNKDKMEDHLLLATRLLTSTQHNLASSYDQSKQELSARVTQVENDLTVSKESTTTSKEDINRDVENQGKELKSLITEQLEQAQKKHQQELNNSECKTLKATWKSIYQCALLYTCILSVGIIILAMMVQNHYCTLQSKITDIETVRINKLETKLKEREQQIEYLILNPSILWLNTLNYNASRSSCDQIVTVPVILKISGFYDFTDKYHNWYSEPFYTHQKGYKLCLRVQWNERMTTYLYLMKGPFDDQLQWPISGRFEVILLNLISNSEHRYAPNGDYILVVTGSPLGILVPIPCGQENIQLLIRKICTRELVHVST